jgi:hypothetical protein
MGTRITRVPMRAELPEPAPKNSPSRWRFCPLDPMTFRFRVRPPG